MQWGILILQVLIGCWVVYLRSYAKKKAELLATKEDIGEITEIVESIKLEKQRSLSEFDVKLESFRKVIEIRIHAADKLANIRKNIWDLYAFQKGSPAEITLEIQSFTTYMNAYIPFFENCRRELDLYSIEMKKIERKTPLSNDDLTPAFKAMEVLMAKILEYK